MPAVPLTEQFELHDGIWLPKQDRVYGSQFQKDLWDQIGTNYYGRDRFEVSPPTDYKVITSKIGGLWSKFPRERHFSTILEIGCGDGRASIHLSKNRGIECDNYYGIDLSEPQLRRLQKFKEAYDFYPTANFYLACMAAKILPLPDNSVDLVISDSVFMHLMKADLEVLMREICRVVKPEGLIAFRNSFHNRDNFAHLLRRVTRKVIPGRSPVYSEQHSYREINRLFDQSGLNHKIGPVQVVSDGEYVLLPYYLGGRRVPLAKAVNRFMRRRKMRHQRLIYSFDAYNW
jgi:ubiquinone/menaquinone biosynthesis C-methylase UbiE